MFPGYIRIMNMNIIVIIILEAQGEDIRLIAEGIRIEVDIRISLEVELWVRALNVVKKVITRTNALI